MIKNYVFSFELILIGFELSFIVSREMPTFSFYAVEFPE